MFSIMFSETTMRSVFIVFIWATFIISITNVVRGRSVTDEDYLCKFKIVTKIRQNKDHHVGIRN